MTDSTLETNFNAIGPYVRPEFVEQLRSINDYENASSKLPLSFLVQIQAPRPSTSAAFDVLVHGHATKAMETEFRQAGNSHKSEANFNEVQVGHAIVAALEPGDDLCAAYQESGSRSLIVWTVSATKLVSHMRVNDWSKIIDIINIRDGNLHLIVEPDPQNAATEVAHACRDRSYALFDGSYVFFSAGTKNTQSLSIFIESLKTLLRSHEYSMGWFEDEVIMMTHAAANFARHAHFQFPTTSPKPIEMSAIVVGNGPSLDESMPTLLERADRAMIFSGGTSTGTLLKFGITPDFHCEFENDPTAVEIIDSVDPKKKLKETILIAPPTVCPSMVDRFKNVIFFYRDSVTPTRLFTQAHEPPALIGPTVTNTALRAAIGFGFVEIVLLGVDLGSRKEQTHHSTHSIYLSDKGEKYNPGNAHTIEMPGNGGGVVYTNREFLNALTYFEKLISLCVHHRIYNCSGGIYINGTRAAHFNEFKPPALTVPKAEKIKALLSRLRSRGAGELVEQSRLEEFSNALKTWSDDAFEALELSKGKPLFHLVNAFASLVQDGQADTRHGPDAAVNALFSGTIHEILKAAHFFERRLETSSLTEFRQLRDAELKMGIEKMLQKATHLFDEIADSNRQS